MSRSAEQMKMDVKIAMIEQRGLQFLLPPSFQSMYQTWLKQPQDYKDKIRLLAEKY